MTNYIGELAALSAAFLWAVSSTIYTYLGQSIPPLLLNLFKGIAALFYLVITLLLLQQPVVWDNNPAIFLLLISGVIGIGIGDTAYFNALNSIGARRTLLLETLAPPIGAVLAQVFLGETLKPTAWGGIFLTILGVAWVISERAGVNTNIESPQGWGGVYWALFAAFCQATGAVLSRHALLLSGLSSLWSTLLRIAAAMVAIFILLLFNPPRERGGAIVPSWRLFGIIVASAFISTYLGIWLQQTSLQYSPVGIAQTLLATSPLFVLPIVAFLGDKITPRAIVGVIIALGGIFLLFQ
ncbi:MAG: DMT family transporter [Chlorogloea purpurea SAG 13.99]|nr:DMT family transporter [Chlorogloea purpurea SAG 13.99]